MKYLLDTNILSEATKPIPNRRVMTYLEQAGRALVTAAPVRHELEYGRQRLPVGRRRRAIEEILDAMFESIDTLPYDAAAARWHARERARLERVGATPPFVDGQIAAIAAANDLVLVTRNVADFAAFHGIDVESWF